jgi:ATP-binding cassette subfamily B protein
MAEVFQHTLIQCLTAVAQHHGLQISPERLISEHALGNEEPGDLEVVRIAEEVGLKAKAEHLSWDGLLAQGGVFPLIARLSNGRAVIVVGVRGDKEKKVAVLDPLASEAVVVMQDQATFCRQWQGKVIFVKREYKLSDPKQPFGFRWFIPEILKQKDAFRDILIAAVAMNVLGMASPIFFKLVIDKVLTHQSETTLWVLGAGMVLALLFDALFGYLRQVLTLAATNKIDMRLTRRVFSHLLTLPIDYFETATAGVITRHMQQLERIRGFLTGRIFITG